MPAVTVEIADSVATIAMDDGKANALSPSMFADLSAALDEAEAASVPVVLTGRDGVFSGGFDLTVMRSGGTEMADLLRTGFEFAHRLLSFPTPVVVAASGHTVAMGVFVTLAADYRIGVADSGFRIVANEVAIGLVMPRAAIELCRQRLSPAAIGRVVNLAETFNPDTATAVGLLDEVVPADRLLAAARERAQSFNALDMATHTATKLRLREPTLTALWTALEADDTEIRALL